MRNKTMLASTLSTLFLFMISHIGARSIEGLWQNERQSITVQIVEENSGIRAKRSDQPTWYRYQRESANRYVDINGNRYNVINDNQIEWRESGSTKRLVLYRVNDGSNDESTDRNERVPRRDDDGRDQRVPQEKDNDRWYETGKANMNMTGRWYDRSNKQRIMIEAFDGGYRVRTEKGQWEKYNVDKNDRISSRSGNTIRMIDRNTLEWRNSREREERIYIRQGNGNQHKSHGKGNGKVNGNRNGHGNANGHAKHDKKCCG